MLLVAPTAAWLFGWRPYIALTAGEVVIQNPLRKHRIPLGAVIGARAGYSGLSLDVRGRKHPLGQWAAQKRNHSPWPGLDTRAELASRPIAEATGAPGWEP